MRPTKRRRGPPRPGSPPAAGAGRAVPFVAIVGRPNVGKSTLFNRLMGKRISIVDRIPGTTRDRVSALLALPAGGTVELCDTGGLGGTDDAFDEDVDRQIGIALARADLVLFTVDARAGATPLDQEIARRLLRLGKPVVLAANKAETQILEDLAAELYSLGLGEPIPVSAKEGLGRAALMERLEAALGDQAGESDAGGPRELRVAVLGRRNAGKSSYVNALLGDERVIVSERPGTTRDAIDVRALVSGRPVVLIDTAGLRKRGRADDAIELIAAGRAREAVRRCDVALVLLDAIRDLSEIDKKIAELCALENRAVVFVATKWDLVMERMTPEAFAEYVRRKVPTLSFAPVVFVSAKTGFQIEAPIDVARELHEQSLTRVATSPLNRVLRDALARRRPRLQANQTPKLYFGTQVATNPVTIILMVNKPALFDQEYRRYLASELRAALPFKEVPLKLVFRERRGFLERGLAGRVGPERTLERTRRFVADEAAASPEDVLSELDHDDVRAALAEEVALEEGRIPAAEGDAGGEDLPEAPHAPLDRLYGEDADVVRERLRRKRKRRGGRRA